MKRLDEVSQETHYVALHEVERHPSRFELAQVEHLVDELQQLVAVALYQVRTLLQPFFGALMDLVGHATDDGERGAELVGDVGVESGLEVVQIPQVAGLSGGQPAPQVVAP